MMITFINMTGRVAALWGSFMTDLLRNTRTYLVGFKPTRYVLVFISKTVIKLPHDAATRPYHILNLSHFYIYF